MRSDFPTRRPSRPGVLLFAVWAALVRACRLPRVPGADAGKLPAEAEVRRFHAVLAALRSW